MKPLFRIILFTGFVLVAGRYTAAASPVTNGKDNDTTSLKSNIVLFKIMTGPAAPAPASQSKSLKKAGSVARTSSNLHSAIVIPKPVPNQG